MSHKGHTKRKYFFIFDCADYGKLHYEVEKVHYEMAVVGRDEYYLIVVQGRFRKYYNIVSLFSTEEYTLSPDWRNVLS